MGQLFNQDCPSFTPQNVTRLTFFLYFKKSLNKSAYAFGLYPLQQNPVSRRTTDSCGVSLFAVALTSAVYYPMDSVKHPSQVQ